MQSPKLGPREVVYQDRYQQIYRVRADFGSFHKEYFVRDTGARAAIVIVKDRKVLLVRQYRLLIDRLSWEIPGGRIEDGEDPVAGAIRECLEETGMQCRTVEPLVFFQPGLDISNNPTHVLWCHDFVDTGTYKPHPTEIHEHVWVALEECIEMIHRREIVDSLTIIGLFALSSRLATSTER